MVKAIAPNAPSGAARTTILTIAKKTSPARSSAPATGAPPARERPWRTGQQGEQKDLQRITGRKRGNKRVGNDVHKPSPTDFIDRACETYGDTAPALSAARSTLKPAPGLNTNATAIPTNSASVETASK